MEATSHKEEEIAFSLSQIRVFPYHTLQLDIEEVAATHEVELDSEVFHKQSDQALEALLLEISPISALR